MCFLFPIIKYGDVENNKGLNIYIYKDAIHSDYIFESDLVKNIFPTNKKYIKIGWGDRKIFLETQSWKQLKIKDFLKAFFGLNQTVLRIEHLEQLPKCKSIELNRNQLEVIILHIKNSYNNKLIQKQKEYYQNGDYYESNLQYNFVNTCNNWINQGLRKAKISNRIWCPITFWIAR